MNCISKQILVRNLQLQAELKRVLQTASKSNTDLLVLKGLSYFDEIYSDLTKRAPGDIDLLVKKNHLQKAASILQDLDYKLICKNRGNHYCFWRPNPGAIMIELHWDLFNRNNPWQNFSAGLRLDECWNNKRTRDFNGVTGWSLSKEDELTYACLHAIKEVFSDSKWLADIELMQAKWSGDVDWEIWWKKLSERQLVKPVLFVLKILEKTGDKKNMDLNRKLLELGSVYINKS